MAMPANAKNTDHCIEPAAQKFAASTKQATIREPKASMKAMLCSTAGVFITG
ncbi:MAG: hypothetical protein IV097_05470 [Burkholderiaceae bacterium]|nr:hypothetical protein [Burkholderiaceae bacterium]